MGDAAADSITYPVQSPACADDFVQWKVWRPNGI